MTTALENRRKPVKVRVNTQNPATVGRSIAGKGNSWTDIPATTGTRSNKCWKTRVKPIVSFTDAPLLYAEELRIHLINCLKNHPGKLPGMLCYTTSMIKVASAAVASLALAAPAFAGPYANIENNAGWAGSTFGGSSTDLHIGYEGAGESASWYIQGGPTVVAPNGGTSEVELGGKVGGSIKAADKLAVYGEFSFLTGNAANGYGTKVGAKYSF